MGAAAIKADFGGWATKADLECTDGLTIGLGAFAHQDGKKVPLVWSHKHDDPELVLGHAILKNMEGHTYSDLYFNPKSPKALATRLMIEHGSLDSLSIWANQLKKVGKRVVHGMIREVSVVLSGANPGAKIDFVNLHHSDWEDDFDNEEALIQMGLKLEHDGVALDVDPAEEKKAVEKAAEAVAHAAGDAKSAQDVYDSMTTEQQEFLHQSIALVLTGKNMEHSSASEDNAHIAHKEGTEEMTSTRNAFENQNKEGAGGDTLAHSDILVHGDTGVLVGQSPDGDTVTHVKGDVLNQIFHTAKEDRKSMRQVAREYAREQDELQHGITNMGVLFPDAKAIDDVPQLLKRRTEWVSGVLSAVSRRPFARIKTIYADITGEEARARGHLKGGLKVEEYFGLAKRVTTPTMVYKRQKLDREDILEITDYNVVAFMKGEMRLMTDEEIARAILIGDGRADGPDKIKDPGGAVLEGAGIRSIYNDHELYAPRATVNLQDAVARGEGADKINEAIAEHYKGSGSPVFYSTLSKIGKMVRERDADGRRLYRNRTELAEEMGVSAVIPVEVMETIPELVGIVVNLSDYVVGTNQGGELTLFDDFDLDYNQQIYLLETFLSGALRVLKSAVVIIDAGVANAAAALVLPAEPDFDASSGELTITDQAGVVYKHGVTTLNAAGSPYELDPEESWTVNAIPASNAYYFASSDDDEWTFTADA